MTTITYQQADLNKIAAGAAVLGSGGGGSYLDGVNIVSQLPASWSCLLENNFTDSLGTAMVLAMEGSPDAGDSLTYTNIMAAITNTMQVQKQTFDAAPKYAFPVETGALNSLIPLLAAGSGGNFFTAMVNGDGAGRAVPELTDLIFSSGKKPLPCGPGMLANSSKNDVQTAVLNGSTAGEVENLTRGVVSDSFGSIAGLAAWCNVGRANTGFDGNFIPGTVTAAWSLGDFMLSGIQSTSAIANAILQYTGQAATPLLTNGKLVNVSQTTSGGFDAGVVTLTGTDPVKNQEATFTLYNLNENLMIYSSLQPQPIAVAPDLICYYSESTGRGFSNSTNDLAQYLNTGAPVSIIKVKAYPQMYSSAPVMQAWASLLQKIGYAGAMPTADSL